MPESDWGIMKAYIVDRYAKHGVLRLAELAEPVVGENDILVEVHASGVNPLDCKLMNGEFKLILPYKTPFIPGHEVAGRVVGVGGQVRNFKLGDEIYARPRDGRIGTFTELIAIDEADVALKPKNLSMEEAASIPLVGLTAWQALITSAGLKKGQKIFIQAGSGGVGTFAIQLAKHLGAWVATTASQASTALVRELGADVVVDYKKEDFEKVLAGYDVVLNSQDASTLAKSLKVLKPGGKLISISGPPDPAFASARGLSWGLQWIMALLSLWIRRKAKRSGVTYSFLFMKADGEQLRQISALIEAQAIRPVVDRVFAFAETNEALSFVETGRAKGKVVIKVR